MANQDSISIEQIKDFGKGDAYGDERLYECFLDTPVYKKAERGDLLIVEGGKGSGKSAILKYIDRKCNENRNDYLSLLLSDKDYKKGALGEVRLSELSIDKIAELWTATVKVELIKAIYAAKGSFPKTVKKDLGRISRLIRDTEVNQDFLARLWRSLGRIARIDLPEAAGFGGGGFEIRETSDKFPERLEAIIPNVKNILKTKKVYLLLDDTDSFIDLLHTKYDFISGLIAAANVLKEEFQELKDFVILVSVRSDILTEIAMTYHKISNLRDYIKQIRWDKDELKNLITERIKKPFKLECDADTAWNMVFDQRPMDAEKTSTFDYILERSFFRPRDIIRFCNLALEDAKTKKNERITEQNIRNAESIYSDDKYEDISAEYKHKYGERLSDLLLEPFRNTSANLSAFDLGNIIISKIKNAQKPKPNWMTPEIGKEEIMEIMYEIGILGVKEGRHYVFSFQKETKNLHEKEHFQIHKAFHKYLNIS